MVKSPQTAADWGGRLAGFAPQLSADDRATFLEVVRAVESVIELAFDQRDKVAESVRRQGSQIYTAEVAVASLLANQTRLVNWSEEMVAYIAKLLELVDVVLPQLTNAVDVATTLAEARLLLNEFSEQLKMIIPDPKTGA